MPDELNFSAGELAFAEEDGLSFTDDELTFTDEEELSCLAEELLSDEALPFLADELPALPHAPSSMAALRATATILFFRLFFII